MKGLRDYSSPSFIGGRLSPLGFTNYAEYLASEHWQDVRRLYRESDRPQRCRCGARGAHLHHLTYERLGAELLTDLLLLCQPCHERIHRAEPRKEQRRSHPERKRKHKHKRHKRPRKRKNRASPAELAAFLEACSAYEFKVHRLR